MSNREFDAADWHTACNGVVNPWFVTRTPRFDGRTEYAYNANDNLRRFKTREAAQKLADKLQAQADMDDAREHARLAAHHLIRATDGVKANDPKLALLQQMTDLYLELTGVK